MRIAVVICVANRQYYDYLTPLPHPAMFTFVLGSMEFSSAESMWVMHTTANTSVILLGHMSQTLK